MKDPRPPSADPPALRFTPNGGLNTSGYHQQGEATQHRLVKLTLYSSQELLDELRRRLPPA